MTTVVVTQQPGPQLLVASVNGHRDWTSGVCSCFDDCSTCMYVWCCTPCAIADISTRTGECCYMTCCVPGGVIALRARIRTLGGIRGSLCNDCLTVSFCELCALCQMRRELAAMQL